MQPYKNIPSSSLVLMLLLLLGSCSRHLVPTHHSYHQYPILDTITANSDFVQHYQPYKQQVDSFMARIVGYTDVDLTRPASAPETSLGNFFAEALLDEAQRLHPEVSVAFGTKGGLRRELNEGAITVRHIFELMPFENNLVILEISGKQLLLLANYIAATQGQPVAGLRMKINNGTAQNIAIAGKPLDTTQNYLIATYDFLVNGGDQVQGLSSPIRQINTQRGLRDVLIDYVSRHNPINISTDGRITFSE